MKIRTFLVSASLAALILASCKKAENTTETPETATEAPVSALKIVSLNGAVTEIVSALGHEKEIVAVDVTSTYPESIKTTATDLGHTSRITPEAIIALKPTHVLGTDKDINPDLEQKLTAAGIKVVKYAQEFTVDGAKKMVADVAGSLEEKNFESLQNQIDADLKQVKTLTPAPKVLFIYARGANQLMVSGTGTAEDKVITLAGGANAVTDFADFKPLTPEALIKANPDVIFMYTTGLESLGGAEGALKIPGVDKTNAGKNKKIVSLDGGLVHAFGPRVGQAATALNALLSGSETAQGAK